MQGEDLSNLAKFVAVAEKSSFTRATAKLGVSQSALSHAVRRLEEKLGLRLLTRTPSSVAPTEAGERLLETLRPAFNDIETKLASLTAFRERPAGTVGINIDAGLTGIVAGRFDAGVRLGESLEKDMIAVRTGPDFRMAAFAAPAYFARRGIPRMPEGLTQHSCINLRLGAPCRRAQLSASRCNTRRGILRIVGWPRARLFYRNRRDPLEFRYGARFRCDQWCQGIGRIDRRGHPDYR